MKIKVNKTHSAKLTVRCEGKVIAVVEQLSTNEGKKWAGFLDFRHRRNIKELVGYDIRNVNPTSWNVEPHEVQIAGWLTKVIESNDPSTEAQRIAKALEGPTETDVLKVRRDAVLSYIERLKFKVETCEDVNTLNHIRIELFELLDRLG